MCCLKNANGEGVEVRKILHEDQQEEVLLEATLFRELRDVFDRQKLYLDPELNLKAVIRILGTNRKYLYQAITDNTAANFRSFINRYRIDEAKRIMEKGMQNDGQVNLSEIYSSAGFNSSASFYRAFKQVTGLVPRDYLREIKSELKTNLKI